MLYNAASFEDWIFNDSKRRENEKGLFTGLGIISGGDGGIFTASLFARGTPLVLIPTKIRLFADLLRSIISWAILARLLLISCLVIIIFFVIIKPSCRLARGSYLLFPLPC